MAFAAVIAEPRADLATRQPQTADHYAREHVRRRFAALVAQRQADATRAEFRPAYVERLQEIRRLKDAHRGCLARAYAALEARIGHDRTALEREWEAVAATWSFARVNRLIDEHNERYPVERSLPFDPAAGDYAGIGGRPYRRTPLDARWVLDRFPVAAVAA